jgi:hypothetical protein
MPKMLMPSLVIASVAALILAMVADRRGLMRLRRVLQSLSGRIFPVRSALYREITLIRLTSV